MENTLHTQKVAILSRLIKESTLTLEEALLLLKEKEVVEPAPVKVSHQPSAPLWGGHTGSPSFVISSDGNVGIGTSTTTTIHSMDYNPSTTTVTLNNLSTLTADINN